MSLRVHTFQRRIRSAILPLLFLTLPSLAGAYLYAQSCASCLNARLPSSDGNNRLDNINGGDINVCFTSWTRRSKTDPFAARKVDHLRA